RMAADEDESQPLVGNHLAVIGQQLLGRRLGRRLRDGVPFPDTLLAKRIENHAARRAVQTCRGIVGHTALRPGAQRAQAGFGEGVLRQRQAAISGGKDRNDAAACRPKYSLESGAAQGPRSGRTSIAPSCTRGMRLAISMASSRLATSTR